MQSSGGATILRVGVQTLLRSKRAENLGVVPHICHSGGYGSCKERHMASLSDSVATISYDDMLKQITNNVYLAAFRFSSCTEFKMLDCMSNFQCYCCSSKLTYRKHNFQVLKPDVNCVTFTARPAVVPCRCTTLIALYPLRGTDRKSGVYVGAEGSITQRQSNSELDT